MMNKEMKSALDKALDEILAMSPEQFLEEAQRTEGEVYEFKKQAFWGLNLPSNEDKKLTVRKSEDICYEPLTWVGEGLYNHRRIVSAANKYTLTDGRKIILPCVRHSSHDLHKTLDIFIEVGLLTKKLCFPDDQGFIDQYSNWWSREEAFIIATSAGQVNNRRNGSENELYSEGLY